MHNAKDFFVIVNYNSGHNIISCIQSILSSKGPQPTIVVVDNASRDNSLEECKSRFPKAIYIYNSHNIGFAAAANIGARYALERNARTVTFCNPDVILHKNCISYILHAIENGADIVSPIIYKDISRKEIWFAGGTVDFKKMRAIHKKFSDPLSTPPNAFISGCVMTVAAPVFQKIGLFDERFFLYYEDADFSLRAQKNDFTLRIAKDAYAFHKEVSEENKEIKTYFLVLSGLFFFSKHSYGIKKIYFHIHHILRKIKNYFDRKRNTPLAESVHKAFIDYKQRS